MDDNADSDEGDDDAKSEMYSGPSPRKNVDWFLRKAHLQNWRVISIHYIKI